MKPIIGLTVNHVQDGNTYRLNVNEANLNAILENGGIPFMLSFTEDEDVLNKYIDIIDGIFFTGGNDISPLSYNEDPIKELGSVSPKRDIFEIKMYKKAADKDMPILGICRGTQLINVAAGGNLYQDIYAQRENTNGHSPTNNIEGKYLFHKIKLFEDSILMDIFNAPNIYTNSFHHQAVKDVASDYKVIACSEDGIIEGIQSKKLTFSLGIQCHPELMYREHPKFSGIFKAFVDASKEYSNRK